MAGGLGWNAETGSLEALEGDFFGIGNIPKEQRYRKVRPQDAMDAYREQILWRMQNPYDILPGVKMDWSGT
jgi:hypothetical protein